ncbi:hypothetical protein MYCTH_2296805 [Thermothelomyces thermophilus ATCC 42464]|uniref:DUF4187 domain-containing protein n=2 Tax=Thermothelomyces TaxID=1920207 RepID=G2Q2W5_THET4|nr:uncharacterized protein MYCTH_2296805 [Thermothelomyces thermophilus ATCC 42464]AEO54332.1 hypothetical protein MYCTH_2296805 [Thermothelomyces thermophilus ATCC 42464]
MSPLTKNKPPRPEEEKKKEDEEEEEEDYMTMTFSDDPPGSTAGETSLQRRQRLRREAEARARPKSKAELAAEAEARREAALSRSLLTANPKSKGLAMMAKMGFKGGALGKQQPPVAQSSEGGGNGASGDGDPEGKRVGGAEGRDGEGAAAAAGAGAGGRGGDGPRIEPIRIEIKEGREGIGLESERKRKLREAAEAAGERAKRAKEDEAGYRERMRREREEARWERQFVAAQRVAERMVGEREDREAGAGTTGPAPAPAPAPASRPLKAIPVVWRGLVKAREEAERDRRMRRDLEQGLARLPTYDDADEDEDDRKALGKTATEVVIAEDLDEEDAELDEFNALPPDERLRRVVEYLRREFHYCFWCKFGYPDEQMEGCPGLTEEDHD